MFKVFVSFTLMTTNVHVKTLMQFEIEFWKKKWKEYDKNIKIKKWFGFVLVCLTASGGNKWNTRQENYLLNRNNFHKVNYSPCLLFHLVCLMGMVHRVSGYWHTDTVSYRHGWVKYCQTGLVFWWVTILICKFLLIVLWMRL